MKQHGLRSGVATTKRIGAHRREQGMKERWLAPRTTAAAAVTTAVAIAMGVGSLLLAAPAAPVPLAPPQSAAIAVIAPPRDSADASSKRYGQAVAACANELAVTAPTDGDDALEPGRVAVISVAIGAEQAVNPREIASFSGRGPGDHFGCATAIARMGVHEGPAGGSPPSSIGAGIAVIAVGADRAGDGARGAVEVFERALGAQAGGGAGSDGWRWSATIAAPAADATASFAQAEAFGQAVDLARDAPVLAVGAPRADCAGMVDCGSVHLFVRDTAGGGPSASWRHAQEIVAPSLETSAWFGCSVAVSREWLAIGAIGEDDGAAHDAGSVHLYRRTVPHGGGVGGGDGDGTHYAYVRTLRAPSDGGQPAPFAYFGAALALDGSLLAVGAPRARVDGCSACGAAWVYDLSQTTDAVPLRFTPSERQAGAAFGQALALRAGLLVVGAPGLDAGRRAQDAGTAFVFRLADAGGACDAQLVGPSRGAMALFASSCAIVECVGHGTRASRTLAAAGHLFVEEESTAPSPGVALFGLGGGVQLTAAADTTSPGSPSTAPPSRSR